MEYIRKNGRKVIVERDMLQLSTGGWRKCIIGTNFTHGVIHGGYLSSFNDAFTEELIGIENGIGDIVNAQIGDIKDAYELLRSKINGIDSADIYELSRAVLETVDEYFGGISNIRARMDYYFPIDYEESRNNKISNLKGTGAAMCVERASLAQNLLISLGINSFYKTSGIRKDNNKEVHSYNLIECNGKYYIFDTSMPNLIDGKINPLIAELDKETFALLSTPISDIGISTIVSHYNPYSNKEIVVTYDSGREKEIEVDSLGKKNICNKSVNKL